MACQCRKYLSPLPQDEEPSRKLFRETDKRFKETDVRFKETDVRFKETDARLDKRFKETDARLERHFRDTDRKIKELSALFSSQWGRMVEALVEPSTLRLFQERGIAVQYVYRRIKAHQNGRTMELDLLLENSDEVVVVEVKSVLKVRDVQDFLEKLGRFLTYFPRYADYRVYGAVAGLRVEEEADRYAYRQGLFVLTATGDGLAQIANDAAFQPRDFGQN